MKKKLLGFFAFMFCALGWSQMPPPLLRTTFTTNAIPTNGTINGLLLTGVTTNNLGTASAVVVYDSAKRLTNSALVDLTELNWLDGLTGNVQTQLGNKLDTAEGLATNLTVNGLLLTGAITNNLASADRVAIYDSSKRLTNSLVTTTELGYLFNTRSELQAQIDSVTTTNATIVGATLTAGVTNSLATADRVTVYDASKRFGTSSITITELSFLAGLSETITTALDKKLNITNSTSQGLTLGGDTTNSLATSSTVAVYDSAKRLTNSAVTVTTLSYLDATSSVQTQLDAKALQSNLTTVSNSLTTDIANLTTTSNLLTTDIGNLTTVSNLVTGDIANLTTVSNLVNTKLAATNATAQNLTVAGGLTVSDAQTNSLLTASRALVTDSASRLTNSPGVSSAELEYLDGVSSSIQTQLNEKLTSPINLTSQVTGTLPSTNGGTGQNSWTTGDLLYSTNGNTLAKLPIGSTSQTLVTTNGLPQWMTPASDAGGTVTSVSVTTSDGVSGTVATATTTPAISLTLGDITPASIVATNTVTGSNLSGSNTGDQTITLTGGVTGSGTGSFAATVQTNANLTGHVTSVGNAAVLGSFTVGQLNTAISDADVATGGGTATGSNTGDQTITLTGGVTGSGTGSFAATVVTNANLTGDVTSVGNATTLLTVTVAKGGTGATTLGDAGVLIGNGTGAVAVTSAGTVGQVLTSNGSGVDPSFQAAAGGSTNITDSATNILVTGRILADSATLTNGLTLGATAITATGAELNFSVGVTGGLQTNIDNRAISGHLTTVSNSLTTDIANLTTVSNTVTGKAPIASPTFTGTVTLPTPFTLGATSVTPTGAELNFVAGVTSALQTQLDAKLAATNATAQNLTVAGGLTVSGAQTNSLLTASRALVTDSASRLTNSPGVSSAELEYLDGVSSSIQTQIDAKITSPANLATQVTGTLPSTNGGTGQSSWTTGDLLYSTNGNTLAKLPIGTTGQRLIVTNTLPTWMTPATDAGGTVTSVSVTTSDGVSGTVATATTTPAISLTLGDITPASIAATNTVTGSNLSGSNTGDQTITLTGGVTGSGTGSFAATVQTNANLTGHVTSVGNAAVLGSFTVGQLNTAISDADVATGGGTATGANTGDQTITLTGGVTGSGTGSFAATVVTNANLTGDITSVGNATTLATVTVAKGGTGATTAQAAINTLTAVAGATDEWVLTKDTASGNAIFKAASGGGGGNVSFTDFNLNQFSTNSGIHLKSGVLTTNLTNYGTFTSGNANEFNIDGNGNLIKLNNVVQSWPGSQGAVDTYLKNNGAGTLTWSTLGASGSIADLNGIGTNTTIVDWLKISNATAGNINFTNGTIWLPQVSGSAIRSNGTLEQIATKSTNLFYTQKGFRQNISKRIAPTVSTNCVKDGAWNTTPSAANLTWTSAIWSSELSLFVAVANTGTGNRVMTSPDGITWTSRTSAADQAWEDVTWSPELGLFVAAGNGTTAAIMTSPDGINWTSRTGPGSNVSWAGITWSPELGLFAAVTTDGVTNTITTSVDGITWTLRNKSQANGLYDIVWSPELGLFCAVASSGTSRAWTSPDGITWTGRTTAARAWTAITWSPELGLFAIVADNYISTSPDGITWTERTIEAGSVVKDIAWSPELGLFATVARNGTPNLNILTSSDGINWVTYTVSTLNDGGPKAIRWSGDLGIFLLIYGGDAGNGTTTGYSKPISAKSNFATANAGLLSVSSALTLGSTNVSTTNALMELRSTTKGFLPARMTKTQRDAIVSPATALQVYQTDGNEGLKSYQAAAWRNLGSFLFNGTNSVSVTNTTSEGTLLPTGSGTKTLGANFLEVGKVIRIILRGIYNTDAATPGTLTLAVKYGATVIATSAAYTPPAAGNSSTTFECAVDISCWTVGASGTVSSVGAITFETVTTGAVVRSGIINGTGNPTKTINTTTSNVLDVTATWSITDPDNGLTVQTATIEVL